MGTAQFSPTQGAAPINGLANLFGSVTGANQYPGYSPQQTSTPTNTSFPSPSSIGAGNVKGILPAPQSSTTNSQSANPLSSTLAGAGKTQTSAIPQGYSYDAKGDLTNMQGQLYQPSISQGSATSTTSAPPIQGSTNPANPTTKAPIGQEYGPTGLLQPIQGYSQTNPATFPGLVNQLGNTASAPTTQYTNAQGNSSTAQTGLLASGAQPMPQYTAAQDQYNSANAKLAALRDQYATQTNNIATTPSDLSLANGEQGALYNRFSGQEAALTGEMTAAQSAAQVATGQQSAQQQGLASAGSTANTAAGAATGQQGTQQLGLGAAGALAQPSYLAPGQSPYSPTSNQYGQLAGTQGGSGGLQGIGNISGQIGVGQNVAQLNSYLGGAQVVGNNLNDLITQNNINPTGLTYANGALQFGAQAMSNPAYQKFTGQINDFIGSLAPILGVGGSVTDMKTRMSSQIVNALQSGSTIKDVVSYFLDQAKQKVQGLSSGGGAGVGSQSSGNSNGSVSAGGYNFKQDSSGNWIPA